MYQYTEDDLNAMEAYLEDLRRFVYDAKHRPRVIDNNGRQAARKICNQFEETIRDVWNDR
jgi:hypothetical protein